MLEVTIKYNNYDKDIEEAKVKIDDELSEVFTIENVEDNKSIKIEVINDSTEFVSSTKTYNKLQLSAYIKLLNKLYKEIDI